MDAVLESCLGLGRVARESREGVHEAQVTGELAWVTNEVTTEASCVEDYKKRQEANRVWKQRGTAARRNADGSRQTCPKDEIQRGGGFVDWWYIDDEDALSAPILVPKYLGIFDGHSTEEGASAASKRARSSTT